MRILSWFLALVALSGATSCTYNNPLTIASDTPSVVVFHGTVTDNDGEDVNGPGFIYGPVTIRWSGDKDIKLINIVITFPASGKLAGEYTCTFDSATLEEAFPTATDLVFRKGTTYRSNGKFVCSGITAANTKDNFIVIGQTKTRGFTGQTTDQKFYKADTKLFFYYFPQND